MQNIKIQEIADELGMQSKELLKRVQLLHKDIKSTKSLVTEELAQEIFDNIVLGNTNEDKHLINYSTKNINLYFSPKKINILILEKIADMYKLATQKDYIIASFNFSEISIVKILVAGLINLDIQKYVESKANNKELSNLLINMNKVLDDVDFDDINSKNPLENFKTYIEDYKPEIVYIEGIDFNNYTKNKKVFAMIKQLAIEGVEFEIGFSKIISNTDSNKIKNYFK